MSLKTRYNLYKAQRSLNIERNFKADLFKKLNSAWDSVYNEKYAWYQTVWFKQAIGFVCAILIVASLGTGAYAYASPEVTEGTALYPIKLAVEGAEEAIKITPKAKAKFYLKQIKRREAEKAGLSVKKIREIDFEMEEKTATRSAVNSATTTASGIVQKTRKVKKIKIKSVERKLEKIDASIERAEERLEKTKEIIDKSGIKDEKLREAVKNRLQMRAERRQKRLEERTETQKEKMEKFETLKNKKGR